MSDLWSWRDANELCSGVGGYLPYFLGKQDLDELLDFLKISPHILPYEGFFIGMTLNSTEKVTYT